MIYNQMGCKQMADKNGFGAIRHVSGRLLAERAIEILRNPELAARMGAAGRDVASSRFNVHEIVPRYRALYDRVIAGHAYTPIDNP